MAQSSLFRPDINIEKHTLSFASRLMTTNEKSLGARVKYEHREDYAKSQVRTRIADTNVIQVMNADMGTRQNTPMTE